MKLRAPEETVCDPVWPNIGVQDWYYNRLAGQLRLMQADVLYSLTTAWKLPNPVGLAQDAPGLVSVLTALLDAWAHKWTKRWDNMSDRIARDFATRNMRATDAGVRASFKRAGFTVEFKATRVMQLAYSTRVAANVGLIKSIPQEYLKDVSTQVWNAVTTGGDMHALEQNIQKVYGVANRRAALIARDQNNKAKASFEETRRMELGIETAEWQHSGAGQERYKRPTHVAAGRKHTRYQVKDGWLDPATNTRIWPGTEINCRCTSRSVIPGLSRRR